MEERDEQYFSWSKEQIVKDFEQFVHDEYGNHILESLKDGKITWRPLDIEFNAIVDKWFTLWDFLDTKKWQVIQNNFTRTVKEQDAIEQWLLHLHNQWKVLPSVTHNTMNFDDFIHAQGYKKITDPTGQVTAIVPGHNPLSHNIQTLQTAWKEHVRSITNDKDELHDYTALLDFKHFDPTEKIITIAAVRTLYDNIQRKTKGQQRQDLLSLADTIFDKKNTPIPSDVTWITMWGLSLSMKDFFQKAWSLATENELQSLQDMRLTLKDSIKIAEENKLLSEWTLEQTLFNKKYSDLNRQFQNMANSFVQTDLINSIDEIVDSVDAEIDEYAKIFDIPGNMSKFFEKFGKPSELTNTYTDPVYIALKRREHNLRELLGKAGISHSDKESYTAELVEVNWKINAHKNTHQVSTWDGYFDHISQQIDTASSQTGIVVSGSEVKSTLQKLRDANWDVSMLWNQQNILMKASIAFQLLKVKDKHSFQNLGYSFQSYAQFVSSLYDLDTPSKTTILTQDHVPIELNFTSKKFVGKPLEFHNFDVDDLSSLSNIRVEFELDLNNNPDAENFLRTMTGGPNSHLVQDFFPEQPWFPETITDSSLVEMIDKDGIRYEWYLSPTHILNSQNIDDNIYGEDSHQSAKTYILYTKPADQFHSDRNFVTKKDVTESKVLTEWGKEKPVYINAANFNDWKSINILDKKATLSDGQLKALSLGHMVSQSLDADQLLDSKNHATIQQMIAQQDDMIMQELQQDTRDLWKESSEHWETQYTSLSVADEFSQSWKWLVGWDRLCEVWSRIAVKFPKSIDGKKTLKIFPDSEQLLSMIVKDIQKDDQGNIIGATFGFDTLSRTGKCTLNDITLEGKQLDKISEIFNGEITYIDNIYKDSQDYTSVLSRLENNFSDSMRKKTYRWDVFKSLDFDGKEFLKDKKPITHFISTEKTTDAKGSKTLFDVEYQIEKLWSNRYRITSTPFKADVVDKDGTSKEDNISFDTTTDMAGMLLILSTKKLVPYTNEEYTSYKNKNTVSSDTIPQVKRKWYTLSTIWSVLSWKWKDIVDGIKKKFKEKEEESLKYALFTEWRLMRRLSNGWLGQALNAFDLNVLDDMAWEIEIEGQQFGRKKIEGTLKFLKSFHAANNAYGPSGMGMVKGIVEDAIGKYENWWLWMKQRWDVAASLLYSIDKMKSWYAKEQAQYPAGTYVKILLGEHYYNHYMRHYRQLELEAKSDTEAGKSAQERLAMLEYNFIVSNVRGGDVLEKNNPYIVTDGTNPIFYFQNLYSREFANELGKSLWELKSFEVNSSSTDVKWLIDTNNFIHVYNECKDHMGDVRMKDCLNEFIALQSMAKDADQADKVSQLLMSGILSGVFVNNLSKSNKSDLKKIMFKAGIPYASLIEKYDGPAKIQQLLILATGNSTGDFSKFTYGKGKKLYRPDDFRSSVGGQDKKWLIASFETWFKDNKDQVVPFLHMDPESMKTQDNLIRIWKSNEPDMQIFGKKVDPDSKKIVDEVLKDFYYNTWWRSVTIDGLNYDSELSHTASMIDATFPVVNQYEEWKWKNDTKDHADLIWWNIEKNVPNWKESLEKKYLLSWNINNFFRYFEGIGDIHYNKSTIEQFYRYIRLAKQQKNTEDRIRLMWFFLTNLLYSKWPVPDAVTNSFKKYMAYFEANFDNFDQNLWREHDLPSWEGNFEYVFTEPLSGFTYIPKKEWKNITAQGQQHQYSKWATTNDTTLLNVQMMQANAKARTWWGNNMYGGNMGRSIGKSIDIKIEELRWGKEILEDTMTKKIRTSPIDVNNINKVDLAPIEQPQWARVLPGTSNKKSSQTNNRDDIEEKIDSILAERWIDNNY